LVVRSSWAGRVQNGDALTLSVDLEPEVSFGENLLVGFRGSSRPGEIVVLGATYDAGGVNASGQVLNGADDDASGVAALLEVAGAVNAVRSQLQRSVLLAFFSASTAGLQGSEMLLDDLPRLLGSVSRPVAMLGLRAVGRNGRRPLLVLGASESPALAGLLEKVDRRETLFAAPLGLERAGPSAPRQASVVLDPSAVRGSDYSTFLRAGIPSLLLNDGLDPELYGHPDDDWKYVDSDEVTRVARLAFRFAHALATDVRVEALPASSRP
jgi:Zn-dependent M28 family amino/carboxypeptidase